MTSVANLYVNLIWSIVLLPDISQNNDKTITNEQAKYINY